ncbi:MAG: GAF domain-containing protein, partial [Bdellovibrionota bacterium]
MAQLTFKNGQIYRIEKSFLTVGTEPSHDLLVRGDAPGILFTIVRKGENAHELVPGKVAKIRLNGTPLSRGAQLANCDRIEWAREEAAVFLASESATPTASENSDAMKSLHFLQNLAGTLQATGSVQAGLHQTLDALVEMANAESGYLLSDAGPGWELLATARGAQASLGQARASRRELISNTILQEALQKRAPVYVENIIGHPWSEAASVIEARIFSAACFPLMVGERVLGAVFLLTCSPGRSVRREVLFEANLLATQAALMLASAAELRSARRENSRLRELVQDWPTQLKYDPASQSMAELDRKITKLAG